MVHLPAATSTARWGSPKRLTRSIRADAKAAVVCAVSSESIVTVIE